MRTLFFRTSVAALLLLAAALMALLSPRTAEAVRRRLEVLLTAQLQAQVRIERVALHVLPPALDAEQLRIGTDAGAPTRRTAMPQTGTAGPEAAPPLPAAGLEAPRAGPLAGVALHVRHLRVRPALLVSLLRRPTLDALELQGVQVRFDDALRPAILPSPGRPSGPASLALPIDIIRVHVQLAAASIQLAGRHTHIRGLELHLAPRGWGQRHLQARLGPSEFALTGGRVLPLTALAEGHLTGPLTRPRRLSLDTLALHAAGVRLDAQGSIQAVGPARAPTAQLRGRLAGPMEALLATLGVPGVQGTLHGAWLVQGPLSDPRLDAQLRIEDIGRAGAAALGDLQLEALGSLRGIALQHAGLMVGGRETLSLTGALDLAPPFALDATARLAQAELGTLLTGVLARPQPLGGTLDGELRVLGQLLAPAHVGVAVDLTARPLQLRGARAGGADILAIPALSARGGLRWTPSTTHVVNLELLLGDDPLILDGEVHHAGPGPARLSLRLWAGGLPLEALGPVAGLGYGGTAGLGGTLTGTIGRPELAGHARVAGLRIGTLRLGDSEALLRVLGPTLHIEQLSIARAGGPLVGDGQLTFAPPHPTVQARLEARGIDAGELLATLGAGEAVAAEVQARLYGPIALHGPLLQPIGAGMLRAPELRIAGVPLGASTLAWHSGEGAARIEGTLTTEPAAGALSAHAALLQHGGLQVALSARRLPLALWPAAAAAHIEGNVALQLSLEGTTRAPRGGFVLDVDGIGIGERRPGGIHLVGRLHERRLHVALSMLRGGLHAAGDIVLAAPLMADLSGGLEGLDGRALLTLLMPQHAAALADLSASASGSWRLRGPLMRARRLALDGRLQGLRLAWHGAAVRLEAPATLTLRDGRLDLGQMALGGSIVSIGLSGRVPITQSEPMDLRLAAHGDLSALHSLSRAIDAGHGPFELRVALTGLRNAPRLMGELQLHRGTLRIAGLERPLEHLEAHAIFNGRTVALTGGRATLGTGKLALAGEASVGPGSWADPRGLLSLRLHLEHVPVALGADAEAQLSGNVELSGTPADAALHGDVRIDALRYSARIDLDRLVPRRAAPPLRAPLVPAGRTVRLGLHLFAPNNLLVSSPVLEAEMACDLHLTGTTERMGLLGSVTPLWARAHYRDNLFVLTRASIDFVDEYRIAPQFSLLARTHACQMDADVRIEGSVDGLSIVPSGRDEHGSVDPQDVLACLQLGLRLHNFNGNQKGGATLGDALSSGIDTLWAVSGLDDKVRRILPIRVDELRLTSGWSSLSQRTTPRVLVAKALGPRASLRYSRSLDEYNDQALSLDYRLGGHATGRFGWLTARDVPAGDFGLDLRLHWELR